jgi:hypothetical protein
VLHPRSKIGVQRGQGITDRKGKHLLQSSTQLISTFSSPSSDVTGTESTRHRKIYGPVSGGLSFLLFLEIPLSSSEAIGPAVAQSLETYTSEKRMDLRYIIFCSTSFRLQEGRKVTRFGRTLKRGCFQFEIPMRCEERSSTNDCASISRRTRENLLFMMIRIDLNVEGHL